MQGKGGKRPKTAPKAPFQKFYGKIGTVLEFYVKLGQILINIVTVGRKAPENGAEGAVL